MDHAYGLEQYIIAEIVKAYTGAENHLAAYDAAYGYGAYAAELIKEIRTMMQYTAEKTVLGYELMPLILQLAANENFTLIEHGYVQGRAYLGVSTQDEAGNPLSEADVAAERFARAQAAEELMLNAIKASLTGDEQTASQNAKLYAGALEELITGLTSAFADAKNWTPVLDPASGGITPPILEAMEAEFAQLAIGLEDVYDAFTALLTDKFGSHSELDGAGHLISTQAVSGVGASGVGVAGDHGGQPVRGEHRRARRHGRGRA